MITDDYVYLDYAAATPMDEHVLEAMLPFFSQEFANPSASYSAAREVRVAIEDARSRIARLIGAKPAQITFTAGATEANNLAMTVSSEDAHVLVSAIEHDSIRVAVGEEERVELLPVQANGIVSAEALREAVRPDTELVSISLANGEIGTVQPMRELALVVEEARAERLRAGNNRPLYLHTDASQAAVLRSVNVSSLGVDLMTVSAAKMYGPKQMGLLWTKSGIELHPLVRGGGQEGGLRSGTENVPGIIGFAKAFELAHEEQKAEAARLRSLRNDLQRELTSAFEWAMVAGPSQDALRLDNLLHISFPGLEARRLVILLDQRGIAVGTGAACAASKMTTSPVLEAIGASDEVAAGSLRITLGRPTTAEQVKRAVATIKEVVRVECERVGRTA